MFGRLTATPERAERRDMTRIKCTFCRYRCYDGTYEHNGQICEHHDYFNNGYEYDDGCEYADANSHKAENGLFETPLQCSYVAREEVRFEKETKSFELDDDYLVMRNRKIPVSRIKYLCIDGEVLKGGE